MDWAGILSFIPAEEMALAVLALYRVLDCPMARAWRRLEHRIPSFDVTHNLRVQKVFAVHEWDTSFEWIHSFSVNVTLYPQGTYATCAALADLLHAHPFWSSMYYQYAQARGLRKKKRSSSPMSVPWATPLDRAIVLGLIDTLLYLTGPRATLLWSEHHHHHSNPLFMSWGRTFVPIGPDDVMRKRPLSKDLIALLQSQWAETDLIDHVVRHLNRTASVSVTQFALRHCLDAVLAHRNLCGRVKTELWQLFLA
jgi:hypothetical protein